LAAHIDEWTLEKLEASDDASFFKRYIIGAAATQEKRGRWAGGFG
jgi:hypothetical protein